MATYGMGLNPSQNIWGNVEMPQFGSAGTGWGGGSNLFGTTSSSGVAFGNPAQGLNPNARGIGLHPPSTGFWSAANNSVGATPSNGIMDFLKNNMGTLQGGMNLLQGLGGIYGGLQGVKLAKKQFQFQKDFAERNLANQTKSYNTELERRERNKYGATGWSQEDKDQAINEYLDKHKL